MLPKKVGAVVIGRNEGDRLKASLASLEGVDAIVYVDSGSEDGSVEHAISLGVDAIALDMSKPFTAARARNAGIERLVSTHPDIAFVQTVDGDCTVAHEWIDDAVDALRSNPSVSTVFGRLRECNPKASLYNQLCDDEWDCPIGIAESCGGNAMHRIDALLAAEGFNESLIAGEEPDLCLRLRRAGWSIMRIDAEMGTHDAAIYRFNQWWRRAVRGGFAYAEHVWINGAKSFPSWKRQFARFSVWGLGFPCLFIILLVGLALSGLPISWASALIAVYLVQFFRLWWKFRGRGFSGGRAALAVIGKFAEAWGALKFVATRLLRQRAAIIEYK